MIKESPIGETMNLKHDKEINTATAGNRFAKNGKTNRLQYQSSLNRFQLPHGRRKLSMIILLCQKMIKMLLRMWEPL